jgi:DNA replication protein DnaC
LTTNRTYKHGSAIFNNDSVLTSALLDRLLHHAETGVGLFSVPRVTARIPSNDAVRFS